MVRQLELPAAKESRPEPPQTPNRLGLSGKVAGELAACWPGALPAAAAPWAASYICFGASFGSVMVESTLETRTATRLELRDAECDSWTMP